MSDRAGTVVVLAKEPVPGAAKTRLQTAFSPAEAAALAAAAIEDTMAAVRESAATRRVLAWRGDPTLWRAEFEVVMQPSGSLNDRLTAALDAVLTQPTDPPALLIGMDTPQVTKELLDTAWEGADAVIGLSDDGGFWAIGLRPGHPAGIFAGVAMSTPRTGSAQLARLLALGLSVKLLPPLRDIDLPGDAEYVARRHPELRFARRHAALLAARSPQTCDQLFDQAYAGSWVTSRSGTDPGADSPLALDLARWAGEADAVDLMVVSRCQPPVIDLGCGPGRMVRALTESGRAALGVDMSAVAVELSLARGAPALRRRIGDALPAEGRWGTALLMDSNIGMGGNVRALLDRCRTLVGPGGLIICEVDPDPERHDVHDIELRSEHTSPVALAWSRIGVRALQRVGAGLNLWAEEEWRSGSRAFVALRSGSHP